MALPCIYTYKGEEYSPAEFRAKLATELYDEVAKPIVGGEAPKVIGVSHASLQAAAKKLGLIEPERGTFLTPAEQIERGRALIKEGVDPLKIGEDFKNDKKVSADIISVARAHFEELVRQNNEAIETFGLNSKEDIAAKEKVNEWQKNVVKPMGTEAGASFSALQGETEIDTGTFVGMRSAYESATGKEFTPKQEIKAKELSSKVKSLREQVDTLEKKLIETVNNSIKEDLKDTNKTIKEQSKQIANNIRKGKLSKPDIFSSASLASIVWDGAIETAAKTVEAGGNVAQAISDGISHVQNSAWYKSLDSSKQKEAEKAFKEFVKSKEVIDIRTDFINKKDSDFTMPEVKAIWEHAKAEYLDKGANFNQMLKGVAADTGLKYEQVIRAIEKPKGAKTISDEMYRKQNKRTDAIRKAKEWVQTTDNPKVSGFLKNLPNAFFAAKTFGHGTVGFITHAGMNAFKPSQWKMYFPGFIKQFKFAFGDTANYEKAMDALENDPQFIFWKRSGLAVDPKRTYDEHQKYGKMLGRLGVAGDRGFNALKVYRLDMAKSFYDGLSDSEKADPNTPKEIAKLVNHSTGTSEVNFPGIVNTLFFAPKLEAARWQGLITDPAKAIGIIPKLITGKATPSEIVSAKIVAKNAGEKIAVLSALLAANAGLNAALGSDDETNITDPSKSDFMKFKIAGKTIDMTGGTISTIKFIYSMLDAARSAYSEDKLKQAPGKTEVGTIATQLRYKLSPFSSTAVDIATGTDAMGRPIPFSKVKPKKGEEPYSIKEYLATQQTPIPISEGIRATQESMKERGMTDVEIEDVLEGILAFGTGGFLGVKVQPNREKSVEEKNVEYQQEKEQKLKDKQSLDARIEKHEKEKEVADDNLRKLKKDAEKGLTEAKEKLPAAEMKLLRLTKIVEIEKSKKKPLRIP